MGAVEIGFRVAQETYFERSPGSLTIDVADRAFSALVRFSLFGFDVSARVLNLREHGRGAKRTVLRYQMPPWSIYENGTLNRVRTNSRHGRFQDRSNRHQSH
jgi:hypothetical protein